MDFGASLALGAIMSALNYGLGKANEEWVVDKPKLPTQVYQPVIPQRGRFRPYYAGGGGAPLMGFSQTPTSQPAMSSLDHWYA